MLAPAHALLQSREPHWCNVFFSHCTSDHHYICLCLQYRCHCLFRELTTSCNDISTGTGKLGRELSRVHNNKGWSTVSAPSLTIESINTFKSLTCCDSRKLKNIASFSHTDNRNDRNASSAASLSSCETGTDSSWLRSSIILASKFGVPTNSCMSKRPGLIIALSKALSRLVARKKIDFFARLRSLIAVSIAVVSIRLSMPWTIMLDDTRKGYYNIKLLTKPGLSRSKQNSSISSNRMTQSLRLWRRANTYLILDATFVLRICDTQLELYCCEVA